jgi:hypothetical protein
MRTLRLPITVPVAGVSFHQAAVLSCTEGDTVELRREPTNAYDRNAVAVLRGDTLLGHLPRAVAERFVGEDTDAWAGTIAEVLQGQGVWGLRIRVEAVSDTGPYRPPEHGHRNGSAHVTADIADTDTPAVLVPEYHVYAKSGRQLGAYVGDRGTTVLVRTAENAEVPYPKHLVEIR